MGKGQWQGKFIDSNSPQTKDECYQTLSEMEGFFTLSFLDY